MESCQAHPGSPSSSCRACKKVGCDTCMTYAVDGDAACEPCGVLEDERSRAFGSALLTLVSVGYLATLAIGYVVFRGRPFVGGLSAVVAIALGRMLQMYVRLPVVTRRPSEPRTG